MKQQIQLHSSWLERLRTEFDQQYMLDLRHFLAEQQRGGKTVYPAGKDIFRALNTVPFESVKVVILGQDPYHGPGQAHGLCFSVPEGIPGPPSLVNIFQELESDLGLSPPEHGNLSAWADRGVLLLNSVLTVEHKSPGSHAGKGWEQFTDRVITELNANRNGVVFMLWGSYAQRKGAMIDRNRHQVLQAPHPSPLSAYRGFFGCRHFSQANNYLSEKGVQPIDWSLTAEH